jgi:DNA-binding FadR family transcriptional regulator
VIQGQQDERFRHIARERVSERVAQEILKLISAGTLAPGERLPGERQLAEMMNVSRVSVRAALQQLKAQGMISAVQGGGTRVTSAANHPDSPLMQMVRADVSNLHDLAELRINLEVWAAQRAAERADPSQIAAIATALEAMADPRRSDKTADDHAFHLAVAKATGSAVYMYLMEMMGEVMTRNIEYHRYTIYAGRENDARIVEQHRRVYEAICSRDPAAAGKAMAEHLNAMLESYVKVDEALGQTTLRPAI